MNRFAGYAHDLCGTLVHRHDTTAESVGLGDIVDEFCPDRSLGRDGKKSEVGEWITLKTSPLLYAP